MGATASSLPLLTRSRASVMNPQKDEYSRHIAEHQAQQSSRQEGQDRAKPTCGLGLLQGLVRRLVGSNMTLTAASESCLPVPIHVRVPAWDAIGVVVEHFIWSKGDLKVTTRCLVSQVNIICVP